MSDYHFDSSKMMCIHGRARGGCAECIEIYKKCDHGQLARSCPPCEMREENESLRAQVAALVDDNTYITNDGASAYKKLRETEAKLADCQFNATSLLRSLAPQCEPLDTVQGLLTQIDNWCAGARSDLADCQAVIKHKGHDKRCPANLCHFCGAAPEWKAHDDGSMGHAFIQRGPCSDACGHDRTTGET